MELSDLIVIGLFAGFVSFIFNVIYINHLVGKFQEGMLAGLSKMQELEDDIVDCYIDFGEQVMIMYVKEDNEFVAQGKDWEELNKNAIARYPEYTFNISTEDAKRAKEFNK